MNQWEDYSEWYLIFWEWYQHRRQVSPLDTSTKALNLLSSFVAMCTASEWKVESSPTNISDRHRSFFNPSLTSGLLCRGKRNSWESKLSSLKAIKIYSNLDGLNETDTRILLTLYLSIHTLIKNLPKIKKQSSSMFEHLQFLTCPVTMIWKSCPVLLLVI